MTILLSFKVHYRQEQNTNPQNEIKYTIEPLNTQNRQNGTAKQTSAKKC